MTELKIVTVSMLPVFSVISVGLWMLQPWIAASVAAIWLGLFLYSHLSERSKLLRD